jgi:hypothetical protein
MDNSVKADLRSLEKGISLIEVAHKNGLQLLPDGSRLKLRKDPDAVDYDKQQATISAEILKQNSESILAITAYPDETRELLAQSQIRMIEAHEWLLTHLDLWDRLEKVYRAVFGASECVMGADGCREAAVVCCRTCEKGVSDAG